MSWFFKVFRAEFESSLEGTKTSLQHNNYLEGLLGGKMAEQSRCADSFVDSIGTNTHLNMVGKIYDTGYATIIKPRLIELGLRHIRDNVTGGWTTYFAKVNELGRAGIKFNYIVKEIYILSNLATFASKVSDALESFEGPNEPDLRLGSEWPNIVRTFQQSLYKAVKGNSSLSKFPVIGPSIVRNQDQLGDISAYLDYGNTHFYIGGDHPGRTGAFSLDQFLINASKNSGSKPVIATEFGYNNAVNSTTGIKSAPEEASGKYVPRSYLLQFNRGLKHVYNYELIDQGTDLADSEQNFGLLRNDGSPKPAFTALKNLIALLKDPGPSFTPGSLGYSLSGKTADVHKTLLQKRDGKFYLILWLEKPCYDSTTKQLTTVSSQQVTLDLITPISKAVTYLPNSSTSGTTKTLSTAVSPTFLALTVPDHPIVVELTPNTTAVAVPGGTGLKGQYYDNQDFTNLKVTRTDATVNFNWGSGSPHSLIGADTFSVRWTGQVQPRYSETYTFYTVSSDGVRLWVNGQLVINNWTDHSKTENSGKVTLSAGQKYTIKMEFYEKGASAIAQLFWSSPSQAKEIIPQSRLYC